MNSHPVNIRLSHQTCISLPDFSTIQKQLLRVSFLVDEPTLQHISQLQHPKLFSMKGVNSEHTLCRRECMIVIIHRFGHVVLLICKHREDFMASQDL